MAGYIGRSMSNNAAEAYSEGKKPFSQITKEDILAHGITESITFFRWYVKYCCKTDEWHHSSAKFNEVWFYDIKECCENFKSADIEVLREKYKNRKKPAPIADLSDVPYYAKVDYSISTYSGSLKYITTYAVIHKCWAYFYDDYHKDIKKKKINGHHFAISEKFAARPDEFLESTANEILAKLTGAESAVE